MVAPIHVIAPRGALDIATTRTTLGPSLGEAVGDTTRSVVVDLTDVTLMDSTALGAVARAHDRMRRQGRVLHLVVPEDGPVGRLLKLTGAGTGLTVHPSRVAAEAAATAPAPGAA